MAGNEKVGLAKVSLKSSSKSDEWTVLYNLPDEKQGTTAHLAHFRARGALYNALRVLWELEATVAVERETREFFEVSIGA